MMRVALYTSGRQDWGIYEPVALALDQAPDFQLRILAGGTHLLHGIPHELGGLSVDEAVDTLQASDTALAVAQSAGWTTALLAGAMERLLPDALMLVGDRTETLAAALAATCLRLPILHLHGGEETQGAIDNACRHAISKLSHLHFVAHPSFAARLRQMGEDPERIHVVGAPSLDRLANPPRMEEREERELAQRLGWEALGHPLLLCTQHPTTAMIDPMQELEPLIQGLDAALRRWPEAQLVITRPNADEGGRRILEALQAFQSKHGQRVRLVESLGEAYFGLLARADAMVGNSSSGILEAPSFGLPVVNLGSRQEGRLRGKNVRDVPAEAQAILEALEWALQPGLRDRLRSQPNPYGDGQASTRILDVLRALKGQLSRGQVQKRFHRMEA